MSPIGSHSIRMLPEEFRLLRDLLLQHAGLMFDESSLSIVERKLSERVAALELSSFGEYYKYIKLHPRGDLELQEVVEALTTAETYFFRQDYQLRAFVDELLPALKESNERSKRLTLWSAGCSSGEEVYTLAMLVDRSGLFDDWEVRVIGSDISRKRIASARRGIYRENSFRTTTSEERSRYFEPLNDGTFQVIERIRAKCHFGQLNLMDRSRATIVGRVDAVFCRNVIIYFDAESRARAIDTMYERLVPGGYLLLGHSESLFHVSTAFELLHLREDLVYRKPNAFVPLSKLSVR